jgi:hypothetical protein
MKKIILFSFLFLMSFSFVFSQEKQDSLRVKTNPIFFTGINLGLITGGLKGLHASFDINYQSKNSLITFKYATITDLKIGILFFVPFPEINSATEQFSLLFGKRYVVDGFSYHFSGGLSYNSTRDRKIDKRYNYFGFPIEIGTHWFHSKKKRFRVMYGLIPVGKPTGFGRSFGIKLHANIAKKSYVGLGLNLNLGWHKKYK